MTDQHAKIEWRGPIPVSTRFDDPYFSLEDGLAETRHVFLAGNDLPERFDDGFHIAELGFGTGLNLLTALHAFRGAQIPGKLRFTSFEAFPLSQNDLATALAPFDMLDTELLLHAWGSAQITAPDLEAQIITGDARQTLPAWQGRADAWFLDGFAPAKNPELWGDDLLHAVGQHTAPNGTCATYTAAGHVRRALDAAGFEITRIPGFGRKRHMTIGRLR